jgi:predicted transcriptional regulator
MQREVVITRRGHVDVIADILKVTKEGARKTRIIFYARLNNEQCKKYLRLMLCKGLIGMEKRGKHVLYRTSDKGLKFLREYHLLKEFLT